MSRRLPNLQWGWRMPIKRLSWKLAWWLMTQITMRSYTKLQQAKMISDGLGPFRPDAPPGIFAPTTTITYSGTTKTTTQ